MFFPYKSKEGVYPSNYEDSWNFDAQDNTIRIINSHKKGRVQLNVNLLDLMVACNNLIGFPFFNCPKTFLMFLCYATHTRVEMMIHFIEKGKFSL